MSCTCRSGYTFPLYSFNFGGSPTILVYGYPECRRRWHVSVGKLLGAYQNLFISGNMTASVSPRLLGGVWCLLLLWNYGDLGATFCHDEFVSGTIVWFLMELDSRTVFPFSIVL